MHTLVSGKNYSSICSSKRRLLDQLEAKFSVSSGGNEKESRVTSLIYVYFYFSLYEQVYLTKWKFQWWAGIAEYWDNLEGKTECCHHAMTPKNQFWWESRRWPLQSTQVFIIPLWWQDISPLLLRLSQYPLSLKRMGQFKKSITSFK